MCICNHCFVVLLVCRLPQLLQRWLYCMLALRVNIFNINIIDGVARHVIKVIVQQALPELDAGACPVSAYSSFVIARRPLRSCWVVAASGEATLTGLRRRCGTAVHFPPSPSL